ncbi:MAG: DUF3473 domain-containing protein [Aquificae bacterium]|nr:DUF3473 domain-containing protein [Aquificota bacterium]
MNILTFDIEEWFHIIDIPNIKGEKHWESLEVRIHKNIDRILELLYIKNQKATFFCLGWIGEKYPEVIKKIDEHGHEIGSHSRLHIPVYQMKPEDFEKDTEYSIKTLEDITGKKIRMYRAPSFSITSKSIWALEILAKLGIEIDASIFPASRSHGGLETFRYSKPVLINVNGILLKEFPMNTVKLFGRNMVFSGGGYFRLLPYRLIKFFMKNSSYVMTYFHPRDFDPYQPVLKGLSLGRKFKSYYGLKNAFSKLEKLITDFEFVDIKTAEKRLKWNTKINLGDIK